MSESNTMEQQEHFENTKYCLVLTSDDKRVSIPLSLIEMSVTIRNMLEDSEDDGKIIPLSCIDYYTLMKIAEYCDNFHAFTKLEDNSPEKVQMQQMIQGFMDTMNMDQLISVLNGVNFLDISILLDQLCQRIADMISGKSAKEIRVILNIPEPKSATNAAGGGGPAAAGGGADGSSY
jgi:hypothetical protein